MRCQPLKDPFVRAQLIELPVDPPQRHRESADIGEQVKPSEARKGDVLGIEGITARGEICSSLIRQRRSENLFREPLTLIR